VVRGVVVLAGRKRVLFISGSLGLGHITRDVALADALRGRRSNVEVRWLAGEPARTFLEGRGEVLMEEAQLCGSDTDAAEVVSGAMSLNLLRYLWQARGDWFRNIRVFKRVMSRYHFDIVIGDEAYEIGMALFFKLARIEVPFVMLYDFVGLDSPSKNPLSIIGAYMLNLSWALDHRVLSGRNLGLFVGEPEDIPDKRLGFMLPNRRNHAEKHYEFIGYILGFDAKELSKKGQIRKRLGYGEEPLIVCSVGGTSIGKELLELCGRAYPHLKQELGEVKMMLACGPRIDPDTLEVPDEVLVKGFLPNMYAHFAACDVAIVLGGGTTTLELTALRIPFLFFPLAAHTEQETVVAGRLARHGAGTRMTYEETTPESLAKAVIENLNREVAWKAISTHGAARGSELIFSRFL
jgi:UDP:flavonoid glycosyltransferase YjiC (YdhE family)